MTTAYLPRELNELLGGKGEVIAEVEPLACHRLETHSLGFKFVQTDFVCWAFNSSPFIEIHFNSNQLLKLMLK
jgi:hypothetical protein